WLGTNSVIFNVPNLSTDRLGAKVYNIQSKEERLLSWPIASVTKDGKLATSFSYSRLERLMPGYGYNYVNVDKSLNDKAPSDTGLFIIDVVRNETRLL